MTIIENARVIRLHSRLLAAVLLCLTSLLTITMPLADASAAHQNQPPAAGPLLIKSVH